MDANQSPKPIEPLPPIRTLKIEPDGDPYKGAIKPKIRIMGRWLERAGFKPGNRVCVTCIAPGVIELRSPDSVTVIDPNQNASEESNDPL